MKKYQMVVLGNYINDPRYRIIDEHKELFDSIDEVFNYVDDENSDDYIEDVKIYECGVDILPNNFKNIKESMIEDVEHIYLVVLTTDYDDDGDNDKSTVNYYYFGIREK